MTFSQSLNILSSNCVSSVDRNCVLLLLLFFLPTLIDKDKILLCCVMSCQTSPSSTRTTLQQKKPLPKSIITINMCALQNHTVRHERHRSSIDNVSSLHLVLMLFIYLQPFNLLANSNIEIMGEKNQTLENRQKKRCSNQISFFLFFWIRFFVFSLTSRFYLLHVLHYPILLASRR